MTNTPPWWPQVHATVRGMRRFTGLMLELATPRLDEHGTLSLQFSHAPAAECFRSEGSGCIDDLRTALKHHGITADIHVAA